MRRLRHSRTLCDTLSVVMNTFWSILLGGGLTAGGTWVAELIRGRSASNARVDERSARESDYSRTILNQLSTAAVAYQRALRAYAAALAIPGQVPSAVQDAYLDARATFQSLVHRVDPKVATAFLTWEDRATDWTQGVGSVSDESKTWDSAMRMCGDALRAKP